MRCRLAYTQTNTMTSRNSIVYPSTVLATILLSAVSLDHKMTAHTYTGVDSPPHLCICQNFQTSAVTLG